VDEKSMISKETLAEITTKLYGRKLILIGDKLQLPPINEEAIDFEPDFELTEQVRNISNPYLDKFGAMAELEHQMKKGVYPYNFKEEIDKVVMFSSVIDQFNLGEDRVITFTNEAKDSYNALIRKAFSMNNFEDYGWGDFIIFNNPYNSKINSYKNGEIKKVVSARRFIHKLGYNDKLYLPDWLRGQEFEYYEIQFDDGFCSALVSREKERFWKLLDDIAKLVKEGAGLKWNTYHGIKELFADISYAYAVTSHKSQGQTISNAFIVIDDFVGRPIKSAYVALTRHKNNITFII
jgi:ATP-dependent exoDNAse (exonuclease V) alpha subunit